MSQPIIQLLALYPNTSFIKHANVLANHHSPCTKCAPSGLCTGCPLCLNAFFLHDFSGSVTFPGKASLTSQLRWWLSFSPLPHPLYHLLQYLLHHTALSWIHVCLPTRLGTPWEQWSSHPLLVVLASNTAFGTWFIHSNSQWHCSHMSS